MMSFPIFPSINNIILHRYVTCLNSFAIVRLKFIRTNFSYVYLFFAVKSAFIKVLFCIREHIEWKENLSHFIPSFGILFFWFFFLFLFFPKNMFLFCLLLHFHSYNQIPHITYLQVKNSSVYINLF